MARNDERRDVGVYIYDDYVEVGNKPFFIDYFDSCIKGNVYFYKLYSNHQYLCDWFVYKTYKDDVLEMNFYEISFRNVPFNIDLKPIHLDKNARYYDILGKRFCERFYIHFAPLLRLVCVSDDLPVIPGTGKKQLWELQDIVPF